MLRPVMGTGPVLEQEGADASAGGRRTLGLFAAPKS
jgi:hypothetical protein